MANYYSSDDPGAPTLTNTAGDMVDVLRVLVNGIDDGAGNVKAAAAGWSELYYDAATKMLVLDPPRLNGVLQFECSETNQWEGRAAESASDANTVTAASHTSLHKMTALSSTNNWWLREDDGEVILWVGDGGKSMHDDGECCFFGTAHPFDSGDMWATYAISDNSLNGKMLSTAVALWSTIYSSLLRDQSATPGGIKAGLLAFGAVMPGSSYSYDTTDTSGINKLPNGDVPVTPLNLVEEPYYLRAQLRGVRVLCLKNRDLIPGDTLAIGGTDYTAVNVSSSTTAGYGVALFDLN